MPLLMVEKTVPACDVSTGAGSYIYDAIIASLASGKTLYSPGGIIHTAIGTREPMLLKPHDLLGDTSEGYSADADVDESLCPANYTPRAISTSANATPQVILESVSTTGIHKSAFNKLVLNKLTAAETLVDKGTYDRVEPNVVVNSPANGQFDTGVTSSSTHIHELFDIIDNYALDNDPYSDMAFVIQPSDRRRTNQLVNLRTEEGTSYKKNALTAMFLMSRARVRTIEETEGENGTYTTINCVGLSEVAVSRSIDFSGRGSPESHIVKEIEPNSPVVTVTLGGPGQGAIDTAPISQHSILAHETYSTRRAYALVANRLQVLPETVDTNIAYLHVVPLNNDSTNYTGDVGLASWATYGFPKVGRIYLPDGGSAKYTSKTGTAFHFPDSTIGSGDYVAADGTEFAEFNAMLYAYGLMRGSSTTQIYGNFTIYNEGDFGSDSAIENGSTVNDRMHQSLNDVSHDYQLGTQYASTRALVEIPVFSKQFFHRSIGPDNAFKLHIDATHTAHTYNPSPVGRRKQDTPPSDREAQSAYAYAIANNAHVQSATITKISVQNDASVRIHVDNKEVFPTASASLATYQGIEQHRMRKAFLADGSWCWYTNDVATDGYIQTPIWREPNYAYTEDFVKKAEVGIPIFVGGPVLDNTAIPLSSDDYTPSSDFENRGEYYHDSASVKTQGGNVDYGLRQYVSAVEFKAGPEENPHMPKISTKRATAKHLSSQSFALTGSQDYAMVITLSDEDIATFPYLGYDSLANAPVNTLTAAGSFISGREYEIVTVGNTDFSLLGAANNNVGTIFVATNVGSGTGTAKRSILGELMYEVEYDDGSSIFKYQYHGNIKTLEAGLVTPKNSIVLTYSLHNAAYPSDLTNGMITLASKRRKILLDDVGDKALDNTSQAYKELEANIKFDTTVSITHVGEDTDDGGGFDTDAASPYQITVRMGTVGKNLNDLHGLNVKKGDTLFYRENDNNHIISKIGVVSSIGSADADGDIVIDFNATVPAIATDNIDLGVWIGDFEDKDAILNATWLNPYAPGGLRNGDTVWANMSYNNPHAIEGLFAKSRGVLNESQVWNAFNGGVGELNTSPRDSIPLENFLIGNTCLETARNYVQHVNRTIEENYKALGLTASDAPTIAYLDPYLSTAGHARVLLYDVAHDREFIALQDIHMQVQSSPQATEIGWPKEVTENGQSIRSRLDEINARYGGAGPSPWTTQIDVTNGFLSQNPYIRSTQQSKFIESAYSHDLANRMSLDLLDSSTTTDGSVGLEYLNADGRNIMGGRLYGKAHGHHVHTGYSYGGIGDGLRIDYSLTPRTNDGVVLHKVAEGMHSLTRNQRDSLDSYTSDLISHREDTGSSNYNFRDPSTFFDTPDGTRVIPAFLCLKGIRSATLDLSSHEESRLQHLPQWKDMDFVRRLTVDLGEVVVKESVTDTLSAAQEIVRLINQHGALTAQTQGGSAHDPNPFWTTVRTSRAGGDKGTHMGYIRAHIGREVEDLNGDKGYTIVIHSTIPGASGRNYCIWLDNSKGQLVYQPQFLIGHGGRWRNFWALPEESEGENMHPAPMPLNKHGRPFAPVTTLQQYITSTDSAEDVKSVMEFEDSAIMRAVSDSISGKGHNSTTTESLDIKGSSSSLVKGLRVGASAISRINLGGLVASGVPGWAPNAGNWGVGKIGDSHYGSRYGSSPSTKTTTHIPDADVLSDNIGKAPIYGFRFENNLGIESGVRLVYKQSGEKFANDNTVLPNTIEEEVCIFFDDRNVTDGGLTIGRHVYGTGDATGRTGVTPGGSGNISWFGNRWRGNHAPNMTTTVTVAWDNTGSKATITHEAPFDTMTHDDKLGYMGFPKENGCFQLSINSGDVGRVHTYTRRKGDVFYGVSPNASVGANRIISPVLNWTTLVTDELIAAAMAAAINAGDEINGEGHIFDCREMYATDGRTFGEWGVGKNAIIIKSLKEITPLSEHYNATLHQDQGIKAAHLEFAYGDSKLGFRHFSCCD